MKQTIKRLGDFHSDLKNEAPSVVLRKSEGRGEWVLTPLYPASLCLNFLGMQNEN